MAKTFDYVNHLGSPTQTTTRELFEQVLDMGRVQRINADLARLLSRRNDGTLSAADYNARKSELKKRLPAFLFHGHSLTHQRKAEEMEESGLAIYDADHVGDARAYWAERESRLKERGVLRWVALAHVTPSGEGVRLVFARPLGMTIAQSQAWMAGVLGDTAYDSAVSDLARCSFAVPRAYLLRYDPQLLFNPPSEGEAPYFGNPPEPPRQSSILQPVSEVVQPSIFDRPSASAPASRQSAHATGEPAYQGIPYTAIVAEWLRLTGGPLVEGERHTRLFKLACDLAPLTGRDATTLRSVLPACGLPPDEFTRIVGDACRAKTHCQSRKLSMALANLYTRQRSDSVSAGTPAEGDLAWLYATTPPPMPSKVPTFMRTILAPVPRIYRPAVVHAVFPALATHLHDVHFRYTDNTLHEATLMTVLMAGTGAGKSSINKPIEFIMADIAARDRHNLAREADWRKALETAKPNDKKPQRPEGLVVQMIDPDTTNAAFVLRMRDAGGRFLFLQMNEIELFDTLCVRPNSRQQFQIMCLAFDNDTYGQTRASAQAVSEKVKVHLNFVASTTEIKGCRYFRNVLLDGPVSRLSFCTIPEQVIGAELPVYGSFDDLYANRLRPYIDNLNSASGEIVSRKATLLAQKLAAECKDIAVLTQDRVFENLSFRAVVIAWLKACVLYVANGAVWDKNLTAFAQWMLRYDLWCKLHYFGASMQREMNRQVDAGTAAAPNQLDLLPEEFTVDDVVAMRISLHSNIRVDPMLRKWVERGKVERVDKTQYRKLSHEKATAKKKAAADRKSKKNSEQNMETDNNNTLNDKQL